MRAHGFTPMPASAAIHVLPQPVREAGPIASRYDSLPITMSFPVKGD